MMITVKYPNEQILSRYPKERRVVAVIGNGTHGLWVARSLGMNDLCVLTVCSSPTGRPRYSKYSTGVWVLDASPDDPEFLDEIEKLARQYDAGSIMTISEPNHLALIENRDRFEPDIHVFSPSEDAFNKAVDKEYMCALCERLGIPIAKGTVLDEFLKTPDYPMRYPRIMRTRHKHGEDSERNAPWKVAYASNDQEFNALVEQVKPIADNILLQEYHPGVAYNVNVVMHNGSLFFAGAFRGERDFPVAGGVTVQRVASDPVDTSDYAAQLLTELEYEGNAGVDFRYDAKTNNYIFTEINPRFEGGTSTLVRAGYHVPFLLWQSHFEPDKMKKPNFRVGMRTRGFKGCLGWLREMLRGVQLEPGRKYPSKFGAIADFLWHCGPWTKDDTFYWRDPKPYIMERLGMIVPHLPGLKKLWHRKYT